MNRSIWYRYACWVAGANLALLVLSHFLKGVLYALIPAFILVGVGFFVMINFANSRKLKVLSILKKSSKWTIAYAIASIIFAFDNFIICAYFLRNGGPEIKDGMYCLWNHGFVREITKAEYNQLILVEQRMIFGHIHAFSAIPLIFFSAIKER